MITVILMNPPLTGGAQTMRALHALEEAQDDTISLSNLLALPTRSFTEISAAASNPGPWMQARGELRAAIRNADQLHAGWGVGGINGLARQHLRGQLEFVSREAQTAGHSHIWTLLGDPRHPSRWHQFLSDRHGRVEPGSLVDRLRQALLRSPIAAVLEPDSRTRTCLTIDRSAIVVQRET